MRRAVIDDLAFDERLPAPLRIKSAMHFTPVDVGQRAARLLAPNRGAARVLDVGAGAGKFCLAAARARPASVFVGVELRCDLVQLACRLARELRIDNVEFVHGDAFDLDWSQFDAFYMFNPFAEQMFESGFVIDRAIELTPDKYATYVAAAVDHLSDTRIGTRVVTYHGFGADPPAGFQLVTGSFELELWIKTRRR